MNGLNTMLKNLEVNILNGVLTKGKCVDYGTVFCAVTRTAGNVTYHQYEFEQLNAGDRKLLQFAKPGDVIGAMKIITVFDAWLDKEAA